MTRAHFSDSLWPAPLKEPELPSPEPVDPSARLLLVLALTVGLTMVGLAAIAFVSAQVATPITHDAAFDAEVTVVDGFFYSDQPAKSLAYQAGCAALPILIGVSFYFAWRWTRNLSVAVTVRSTRVALVFYLVALVSCGLPIVYCPHPPLWILPPSSIVVPIVFSAPFFSPARILVFIAAAAFGFYLVQCRASHRRARNAFLITAVLWALIIPSRFYLSSEVADELRYLYHFNSVFDALSQCIDGHHLLVDFPHIYGGYIEILAPLFRLFPRESAVPLTILGLTNILAVSCLLLAVAVVVRRPVICFVCGLTMLGVIVLAGISDLNYGFLTARLCLAPMALLAAILYFRTTGTVLYSVTTLLAAVATIWNLDTGIVFWLSWVATLCAVEWAARNFLRAARHVAIQLSALASAWIVFLLCLRFDSGHWPDLALLFYFQSFVVSTGYFCLPILVPDTWLFIVIVYLTGLAVALGVYVRGEASWRTPVTLLLSLFGLGLFSYFMGRSAVPNLIGVSYPAVLLAGIFCSEGHALVRAGKLPALARLFLLPLMLAMAWWSFLMVAAVPEFLQHGAHNIRHWNDAGPTPFRTNVAFVRGNVSPNEPGVFFLSNDSGFYYYLTDTVRALPIPGMIELLRARDMNVLIDAIQQRRIAKLFVEQNFYSIEMYRPDIYDRIHAVVNENYRIVATSPTGKLVLCVPK